MAPIDDETLDRLLTRHAARELDGHLGRAEAAFRENVAATMPDAFAGPRDSSKRESPLRLVRPPVPSQRESRWERLRRNSRWYLGIAGTAIAASVATLLVLPHVLPVPQTPQNIVNSVAGTDGTPMTGVPQSTPVATSEHPVVRYVYNQAWDEGTATDASGQPLRRVRFKQVEHYRYYDPQRKATVDLVVPREDVEHYKLDTY